MTERVLFVDDDANVLAAYERQLRRQFELETAKGGKEGLAAVAAHGPFAVIISDMRMPEMDGVQFLTRVRTAAPDGVRIMLTGNSDQRTAMAAVNEGHIFRFLTKPCSTEVLTRAVRAGLDQYRLIVAEKELLEQTLRGSIKVLADVLALTSPTAFGRAGRVRRWVEKLATALGRPLTWQLEVAALLSQLGCVAVPEPILKKVEAGTGLTADEQSLLASHPRIGHDLLGNIPRLEAVAATIAYQDERFEGGGDAPDNRQEVAVPPDARILKVALDYDQLRASSGSPWEALEQMRGRAGWYDPAVLDALGIAVRSDGNQRLMELHVHQLTCRMTLGEDLRSKTGVLLVAQGQEVTPALLERLRYFAKNGTIHEPLRVLVGGDETGKPVSFS